MCFYAGSKIQAKHMLCIFLRALALNFCVGSSQVAEAVSDDHGCAHRHITLLGESAVPLRTADCALSGSLAIAFACSVKRKLCGLRSFVDQPTDSVRALWAGGACPTEALEAAVRNSARVRGAACPGQPERSAITGGVRGLVRERRRPQSRWAG